MVCFGMTIGGTELMFSHVPRLVRTYPRMFLVTGLPSGEWTLGRRPVVSQTGTVPTGTEDGRRASIFLIKPRGSRPGEYRSPETGKATV